MNTVIHSRTLIELRRAVSTKHNTFILATRLTRHHYTPCLKKQSKLFSSELRQISTNFDNFWHEDGKEAKIIRGPLIFHLT